MHVRRDRAEHLILLERVAALHLVTGLAGRKAEEEVAQVHAAQNLFRPARSQVEPHACAIGLRLIRRSGVVNHKFQL